MPQPLVRNQVLLSGHGDEVKVMAGQTSQTCDSFCMEVHHENSDEHEDTGCECVDEELHRRVAPILTAPE